MSKTIKDLKERRSVRSYSEREISREILNEIVEVGMYAPTGMGAQSPRMVVVKDKEMIKKLSSMNASVMGVEGKDPFYGAPIVIIVFGDSTRRTYVEDGSLVMGNLMNAAHALLVDSCWIHRAKEVFSSEQGQELMKQWGIESNYVGIGHCILGYGNSEYPVPKPRKEDYITYVE